MNHVPDSSITTSERDAKLVVRALGKTYGSVVALHPTDLQVQEGEFVTLLGPSGSGKTTLLMLVAGLLEATTGDLWIDGKRSTSAPPWERGIGMVFQNYALFPHLSIFENVAFPLRMRRMPESQVRRDVMAALEMVQLDHTAQRLPRGLSGGQQQRIALARAFVFKPHIILMDEPLGALDKKLRDQLQLEIKNLHLSHRPTILYVTHDQGEALTMSERICLMNGGRIEQLASPQELYFKPTSFFAADFLGDSNFIDGTIHSIVSNQIIIATDIDSTCLLRGFGRGRVGDTVRMMVRPECVQLTSTVPQGWNAIAVTMQQSIFVGGITRHYAVSAHGAQIVSMQLTQGEQTANHHGQMFAAWPPESAVVLSNTDKTRAAP